MAEDVAFSVFGPAGQDACLHDALYSWLLAESACQTLNPEEFNSKSGKT